jgi:hypothetical protein
MEQSSNWEALSRSTGFDTSLIAQNLVERD